MTTVIDADLGAGHIAQVFEINSETVCVLTPKAAYDPVIQEQVRRLLDRQGVDCRECRACPVGTAQ